MNNNFNFKGDKNEKITTFILTMVIALAIL